MTGAPLKLIPGTLPSTFSLGYILSGKPFRDSRFGPALHHKEAIWLLRNEWTQVEVERKQGLVTL